MQELKAKLKAEIVEHLNLEDVDPTTIKDDEALFGEGLGLDSIDALELIVLLDKYYNLTVTNPEDGRAIFQSVNSLAEYIKKQQA